MNIESVLLSYHFFNNYVEHNVIGSHTVDTKGKYTYPFTKALVSNLSHHFYHICMINRQENSSISYYQNVERKLLFGLCYDFPFKYTYYCNNVREI